MDLATLQSLVPESAVQQLQKGRSKAVKQALFDLGYLRTAHPVGRAKAIARFRADYHQAALLPEFEPSLEQLQNPELDGLEWTLLQSLCALDGNFKLNILPTEGQCNLTARIIHYRLQLYGLYQGPTYAPFGPKSLAAIHQLEAWLSLDKQPLTSVQLLGNLPKFVKVLHQSGLLQQQVVCFAYRQSGLSEDLKAEVAEEEEEEDSGPSGLKTELQLDRQLLNSSEELLGKEEALIEQLTKRHKNRRRREERIRQLMERIVEEQKALLQVGLDKEQIIKGQLISNEAKQQQLLEKRTAIGQTIKQCQQRIKALNAQHAPSAAIKALQEQIKTLQKASRSSAGLPQLLAEEAQLALEVKQMERRLAAGLSGAAKRRLKKDLKRHQRALKQHREDIQNRRAIQGLLDRLRQLLPEAQALTGLLTQLEKQKKARQQLNRQLAQLRRAHKKFDNQRAKAQAQREQEQSTRQKRLKSLQERLQRIRRRLNGLTFRFKAQLKRSLNEDYYADIRHNLFEQHKPQELQQIADAPINRFLLRILQLHQWSNGYYNGRLDSKFGSWTFGALSQFVEDIPGLKLKYILCKLGGPSQGYWLLNAAYLFEKMVQIYRKDRKKEADVQLIQHYQSAFADQPPALQSELMNKAFEELNEETAAGQRGVGIGRRIYRGATGLARSLLRGIGKLINLIRYQVKKLLNLFKNFVHFLYQEIREGVVKYGVGLTLLLAGGKLLPLDANTGQRLLDGLNIDPGQMMNKFILRMAKGNPKRAKHLRFCVRLVGRVLKWGLALATGGLTWPKLAVQIALYFREQAKGWLRKRLEGLRTSIAMS